MSAYVEVTFKDFGDILEIFNSFFFTGNLIHYGKIGVFLPANHILIGSPVCHIVDSLGETERNCGKLDLPFFADDIYVPVKLKVSESYAFSHQIEEFAVWFFISLVGKEVVESGMVFDIR